MAYDSLKSLVRQYIKTNAENEITGQILQNVLITMIDELGSEYSIEGIATPSTNPGSPSGKVMYFASQAGTYTYFDGATLPLGIHLLVYNGTSWSHQTFFAVDATPTSGSSNLITSNAVFDAFKNDGGAYDVSVHFPTGGVNGGNTYDLTDAIAKVPSNMRKGGMSIKFIQSSDNNYVQFRYRLSSVINANFTNVNNWQKETEREEIALSIGLCFLRNGSNGNAGASNYVCTCYVPVYGTKVGLIITRPNAANCEYRFGYALTSSRKDLTKLNTFGNLIGGIYKYDVSTTGYKGRILDISDYPTCVGISFTIGEYNTVTGEWNPLRITDFSEEQVFILSDNELDRYLNNSLKNEITSETDTKISKTNCFTTLCRLRNGSGGNVGNTNYVTTQYVPIFGKKITVQTNRPNSANCEYRIGCYLSSSKEDINTLATWNNIQGQVWKQEIDSSNTERIIDISSYPAAVAAQFSIGEWDTVNNEWNPLRIGDFDDYEVYIKSSDYIEDNLLYPLIPRVTACENKISEIADYISIPLTKRNGSGGNAGNANYITTEFVNTFGASFVAVDTNRPNSVNCSYRYGYILTSAKSDLHTMYTRGNIQGLVSYQDIAIQHKSAVFDVSNYVNATIGVNVTIGEYNDTTGQWNPLRISDFNGYTIKLVCSKGLESITKAVSNNNADLNSSVIGRNTERRSLLSNACRINKDSEGAKDFQMLIVTDTHNENLSVKNAVQMSNGFDTIDCMIHCGDVTGTTYNTSQITSCINELVKSEKPWFIVPGNHDVGNTMKVFYGATHKEVYDTLIKPMVDAEILSSGEYTANVPYYYHDFASRKIRLIVVYEYEAPLDVAKNEYWEEVTYDSTKPKMEMGTTYIYDSGNPIILNCGGYTGGSFRLKKTVTTVAGQYVEGDTTPNYIVGRADRVIMQDQAQWFINTLLSTPADYGIVVATHNPSMINSTNQTGCKFGMDSPITAASRGQYSMVTDLLSEIINAYINKTALSLKVIMGASNWHGSSATYLNTQTSGGVSYCYEVTADFSNRNNSYFAGYVAGHTHQDLVFKHNTYTGQYCITPICGNTERGNNASNDVARPRTDGQSYDAVTVISVKKDRVALVRLGNDRTINGDLRDFEVIDTTE